MKTQLRAEETVERQGLANLQRGMETVGGRLFLTDQRLIFESHGLNIRRGTTEIERADVVSVIEAWTRILNLIPTAPNSLLVTARDGTEMKLVLAKRDEWNALLTPPGV